MSEQLASRAPAHFPDVHPPREKRRKRKPNANPFGVTDGMARVMDAYIEAGTAKRAARALGLSPTYVSCYVRDTRKAMREAGVCETGCRAYVLWARARGAA